MKWIKPRRTRPLVIVAAVAVLAVIIAAAVVGVVRPQGGSAEHSDALTRGSALEGTAVNSATYGAAAGATSGKSLSGHTPVASSDSSTTGGTSSGGGTASTGAGTISSDLPPASNGQYLVRVGSMTLVVPKGRLDESVSQIMALTRVYDGYVLSSYSGTESGQPVPVANDATTESEGVVVPQRSDAGVASGVPYADLTIRVPSERFDQAVLQLRRLGTVKALSTSTEDVTGQVVDLRARLRHYRSVEARLLTFLDKADSVGSALAVQNRIDETQLQIEELQAQLKQLSETVTYSTLSISISEKGNNAVAATTTGGRGFWGTIKHSFALMGHGFGTIFTAFGAALPFLLLIGVVAVAIWLVVRALLRRRSRTGSPAPGEGV